MDCKWSNEDETARSSNGSSVLPPSDVLGQESAEAARTVSVSLESASAVLVVEGSARGLREVEGARGRGDEVGAHGLGEIEERVH